MGKEYRTVNDTPQTQEEQKRARILDGAMKLVLAYGYSRTTMDDIARASEISRPALYLLFRNKTDIYRAIAEIFLKNSVGKARAALAGDGPLAERLQNTVETALIAMMRPIQDSPHGAELLDMKNSLAGDIAQIWRDDLIGLLSEAIAAEAARTGIDLAARGLSAAGLANMLLDGLEGMKARVRDAESQRAGARELIRVIDLVVKP